jgi:hypothetical protein
VSWGRGLSDYRGTKVESTVGWRDPEGPYQWRTLVAGDAESVRVLKQLIELNHKHPELGERVYQWVCNHANRGLGHPPMTYERLAEAIMLAYGAGRARRGGAILIRHGTP